MSIAPSPMPEHTPISKAKLEAQGYFPDPGLVTAINLAWQLQMPLLLTGEPGTGKTVFAGAVARVLGYPRELRCDVRSDSTARDLLYRHDAVSRFADAQGKQQDRAADARNYIRLQGLGEALSWTGADRPVLLVDELDKAQRDLPNDLLRELDEGWFEIPELSEIREGHALQPVMGHRDTQRDKPLVIITSNAERQLPDPFLRRCVFHHLPFPSRERLHQIVASKVPGVAGRLAERATEVFVALRTRSLIKKPATSELVQWAEALHRMYRPGVVDASLDEALAVIRSQSTVDWGAVPALQCLVKLRDDLAELGAMPKATTSG